MKYIAACYFPQTPVGITKIKKKYEGDLTGVAANSADGFVFFVNQPLTVGQRRDLLVLGNPKVDQIFHLERMRSELDGPRGYGLRLEYLRIPMSPEEQVSYFNTLQQDTLHRLLKNEADGPAAQDAMPSAVSRLDGPLLRMLHEAMFSFGNTPTRRSPGSIESPVKGIGGRLRATGMHLATATGEIVYVPPPPEQVSDALKELFEWWQTAYTQALTVDSEQRLLILARLHHGIMSIMPFIDGNGRLARLITHFAARELLGQGVAIDLTSDKLAYYTAVNAADKGDLSELIDLIRAALISPR